MFDTGLTFSYPTSPKKEFSILNILPIQGVKGASSTHTYINSEGRRILCNDGYTKAFQIFNIFAAQLDSGVVWVDKGLKSTCHYYNPDTGSGIWLWPSAAKKCAEFFHKSIRLWRGKRHTLSMFFLGAALHLVQDVCVPHHALCKLFNSHLEFEGWVEKRKDNYKVECGGIYEISGYPEDWIAENARLAKKYFSLASNSSPEHYHQAAGVLLPWAQRTTAGFLLHFYSSINS